MQIKMRKDRDLIEIKKEAPVLPERETTAAARPEETPMPKETPSPVAKPTPVPMLPPTDKDVKKIKALDQKHQVKVLCDLAFQKGLDYSIKTARALNNAYVLDEFHDTLIDKLREQLIEKGRLAEK